MRNNAWKIGTSSLALISCFPILLLSLFHRKNNWRRINYQNRIFSCWQRCTTLTYTVEEGSCMSKGIESLRRDLISIWKKNSDQQHQHFNACGVILSSMRTTEDHFMRKLRFVCRVFLAQFTMPYTQKQICHGLFYPYFFFTLDNN